MKDIVNIEIVPTSAKGYFLVRVNAHGAETLRLPLDGSVSARTTCPECERDFLMTLHPTFSQGFSIER